MKATIIILFVLIHSLQTAVGQNQLSIESEIITADTILLVRHIQTDGIMIVDSVTGKKSFPDRVVLNGRPNIKVISQMKILPGSSKKELAMILQTQNYDKKVKTCMNFIPIHAILIIKGSRTESIDISFACSSYMASNSMGGSVPEYMGNQRKQKLEDFFKKQGFVTD
jgi:hypothetical protein